MEHYLGKFDKSKIVWVVSIFFNLANNKRLEGSHGRVVGGCGASGNGASREVCLGHFFPHLAEFRQHVGALRRIVEWQRLRWFETLVVGRLIAA